MNPGVNEKCNIPVLSYPTNPSPEVKIMGKHYLNTLFAPKSVAVFGASERQDAVGQILFQNMLESGFQGELYPINPKSPEIQGKRAYASLAEIGNPVELAVIA